MTNTEYLTVYNISPEIGISNVGGVWTYAVLNGIDNAAEALNEVIQQYQFLENKGFASNHVTGVAPAWTLSGRRLLGDPAQDYIAGLKYSLGAARKSSLRISYTDTSSGTAVAKSITVPCTLANIQDIGGGSSTDDSVFSVEVRFDGRPTLSNIAPLPALAVVSVAGTTAGKTAVYINPAPASGHTYEYLTGAAVALPNLGADPGSNWASWDGEAEITAVTNNKIGIVEVDSDGKAVKGGIAIVTSMD